MSDENNNNEVDTSCCAACGVTQIDDIKLVPCDGCDLVKYCGDECQRDHKSEHKEECNKRAAELRDELLFKQPESTHLGDCPICSLPMPHDPAKSELMICCGQMICFGCYCANMKREAEMRLQHSCPFCRKLKPETVEGLMKQMMKRVKANDPAAISQQGFEKYHKEDYIAAFEYYKKAAALGDAEAHYHLANMYRDGEGVEKNEEKYVHHLKEAAIAGHPDARYNLGCEEWRVGNKERALKHFIIAATQGCDDSLKALMKAFKHGFVAKDVLATALRSHKAAVDAMKSPNRVEADKIFSDCAKSNGW